jgi:hypothetical protein
VKTKISLLLVLALFLAALACNLPTAMQNIVPPSQTSQEAQASTPSLPTAGTTSSTALAETDACKLLSEAKASQILGEAVIPPAASNAPGYSVCTFFTSTGKGIYVTIAMGDQAKKNFLNEISQYQKGCSVSYSGGTNTATPFPPEVEALMSKSVLELFQMDIQMQVNCGGKVEPLPEFGPNAYAYLTPSAFKIGVVTIVSGNNIYGFGYADPGLDIPQMVEKAKEVVRAVLSPAPASGPAQTGQTPISTPTQIGPTLISSATTASTQVGPTLILPPTQIGPTSVFPTSVFPTQVGPTSVFPTQVGPTSIGNPTKVPKPTKIGGPTPVGGPTPIGGPTPVP